jgi:hypothetical protein
MAAKRFRELVSDLASDYRRGLSATDLVALRQAAALTVRSEELQARILPGEVMDNSG